MRFGHLLGPTGVVALALLGCQRKSLDDVVSEHRSTLEAKLAAIHELEPVVNAAERSASDTFEVPKDPVLLEPESKVNAAVIHAEDLRDPAELASVAVRTIRAQRLGECGSILRRKKHVSTLSDPIPKVAESYLEQCEAVRFLFVVRTFEHQDPQSVDDDSFTPGRFEGDVLLYEVATKKSYGGFKISVKSSPSVTAVGEANNSDRMASDFEANMFVAIDDAIRSHLPGALPPKS
jgi:hypothetical protein